MSQNARGSFWKGNPQPLNGIERSSKENRKITELYSVGVVTDSDKESQESPYCCKLTRVKIQGR